MTSRDHDGKSASETHHDAAPPHGTSISNHATGGNAGHAVTGHENLNNSPQHETHDEAAHDEGKSESHSHEKGEQSTEHETTGHHHS